MKKKKGRKEGRKNRESEGGKKEKIIQLKLFSLAASTRSVKAKWRCNQSILKEISPEYSLEGLMLKLGLQYFGHLTPRKRP